MLKQRSRDVDRENVLNSPFRELPKVLFLTRLAIPSVIVFLVGFLFVGVAANSGYFQESGGPAVVPSYLDASVNVYSNTLKRLKNLPDYCLFTEKANDFQQSQCAQFWSDMANTGLLATLPVVLVVLALLLNLEVLKGFYSRMTRSVEKGKAAFSGKVTTPPEAPADLFSWYFCLQPVMVELSNHSQMTVYLPLSRATPLPGETLAIFDGGEHFGKKRFAAVVYSPHIAVVKGA
ncbi:MAG: hypothetical protein HYX41_05790 [Bdellovibrio sp.]|nr:hypothetical protein [Bdellovibrio sp.]